MFWSFYYSHINLLSTWSNIFWVSQCVNLFFVTFKVALHLHLKMTLTVTCLQIIHLFLSLDQLNKVTRPSETVQLCIVLRW
jgi:hypothetical protein